MKKYLLAFSFVFIAGFAIAQCPAGFTWNQSQPNTIVFTNTSTPQFPNSTVYGWDFGDQQYAWAMNPTHIYSVPGTYAVCLTLMDSANMITCTYCDTITVTGTVLCNMWLSVSSQPASCTSCNDGVSVANPVNGTAPYTYSWSDGQTTQTAVNLLPGVYTCCVTDANGCTGCDTGYITVASPTSCAITFAASPQSAGYVFFQSTVTGVNSSYTVTWNFGDASVGTGSYVWHQYANSGTYVVCATVIDSLTQCSATWCDSVTINTTPQSCAAAFYVQLDSQNTNLAWIYNLSTGSPGMSYQWWWGDNTPVDTSAYPTHVYQNTGSYNICLIVVDQANQCTDTMCQLLWVPRLTQQAAMAPFYVNVIPIPTAITEPGSVSSWSLYPNPVSDALTVDGNVSANAKYEIMDVSGRTVQSGVVNGKSISVAALNSGVYFFTLFNEDGAVESRKFIRQ